MATPPRMYGLPPLVLRLTATAIGLLLLATTGCTQRMYNAGNVPAEYIVPPTEDIEEISLSKLANYSVNSQLIERGDVLEVTIVTDARTLTSESMRLRVEADGLLNIPLIGRVPIAGLELTAAEQAIASAAITRRVFQRPYVTVTMDQRRMNRVMVIGAVEEEGVYEIPATSSTLTAAVVEAGGLSDEASDEIQIHKPVNSVAPGILPDPINHVAQAGGGVQPVSYLQPVGGGPPGPLVRTISLSKAATQGDASTQLADGDVVFVKKRAPKPIYVIGLVNKPGEIEMPSSKDLYLLDALAMAGERTLQVADRVIVRRHVEGEEEPVVIACSVYKAKRNGTDNIRLAPGDVVSVEETPLTIAVDTVRGIARFTFGGSLAVF